MKHLIGKSLYSVRYLKDGTCQADKVGEITRVGRKYIYMTKYGSETQLEPDVYTRGDWQVFYTSGHWSCYVLWDGALNAMAYHILNREMPKPLTYSITIEEALKYSEQLNAIVALVAEGLSNDLKIWEQQGKP